MRFHRNAKLGLAGRREPGACAPDRKRLLDPWGSDDLQRFAGARSPLVARRE
jgi:hypothetical protein